jgi:hypothetical protein
LGKWKCREIWEAGGMIDGMIGGIINRDKEIIDLRRRLDPLFVGASAF